MRDSRALTVIDREPMEGATALVATGRLGEFRACFGRSESVGESEVAIDAEARAMLEVGPGDSVLVADA